MKFIKSYFALKNDQLKIVFAYTIEEARAQCESDALVMESKEMTRSFVVRKNEEFSSAYEAVCYNGFCECLKYENGQTNYYYEKSDDYLKRFPDYEIISEDERNIRYENHTRKLTADFKIITEERYNDLLEILPPIKWGMNAGIESFFMSEFYTGSITTQCGKWKGLFIEKLVDIKDKTTWIQPEHFKKAIEAL